jgi:hypothetical protein
MMQGYFAHGEAAQLQELCRKAGVVGASVLIREGWARFTFIDELNRIEIEGSPLAGLVDPTSYQKVLKTATAGDAGFLCWTGEGVDAP